MQQHTLTGEPHRLAPRPVFCPGQPQIARGHHENWDGSGYPDGLAGDRVPIEAASFTWSTSSTPTTLGSRLQTRVVTPAGAAGKLLESNSGTLFRPRRLLRSHFKSLILRGARSPGFRTPSKERKLKVSGTVITVRI